MDNRITNLLNIEYPIIAAAMNWVTSATFVAAVGNAGGMGVLGPNTGQYDPATSLDEMAENLRKEIKKTKELTDKPFAVNYILPMDDTQKNPYNTAIFNILMEENVKIVVAIGFSSTPNEIKKLKDNNITVLYRPVSPTTTWLVDAEKLGVDAIIATGREAGGHISRHDISTFSLVQQITSLVSIPVIAAGGIIDGKGAKAMFALGAEGVYMGTRFLVTHENPASDSAKQAIINANSEDFLELEGTGERTINTVGGQKIYNLHKEGNSEEAMKLQKNGYKVSLLDGDLDNGTISVSPAAGGIKEIKSCKEVIDEIVHYIG